MIPNILQSTAYARPDHVLLRADHEEITSSALLWRVRRRATGLAQQGITAGQHVALVMPSSVEWVVEFHALAWLGAVVVPLSPKATQAELKSALHNTNTHVISGIDIAGIRRLHADSDDVLPPAPERFWPLDEARVIVMTSGTSAETPQPVTLTTQQLLFGAFGSMIRLGHHHDDVWLGVMPLNHIGGLSIVWRCTLYGTTMQLEPRFDAERTAALLDSGRISIVSFVPEMLQRVLAVRPKQPFPAKLRCILMGGAKTPPELLEQCRILSLPVALSWGSSETASQIATLIPGELAPGLGCGAPLPFARVDNVAGALRVRGPIVKNEQWLTSDYGHVDEHGRVHVLGRCDDVIISGGENIAPDEIENTLRQHPSVREAAVVAVPDARWGERPVAFLVAHTPGMHATDAELQTHCRRTLSGFKVPDRFVWCTALPRAGLGKLNRQALRRWLLESGGQQMQTAQAREQCAGQGAALERGEINTRVHQAGGGVERVVLSDDAVAQGHRRFTNAADTRKHMQGVAQVHGPFEVGLGVHQGQAPSRIETALDTADGHAQQLFERDVAVLKEAAKEHHARAVDLEQPSGDHMLEFHDATPRTSARNSVGGTTDAAS